MRHGGPVGRWWRGSLRRRVITTTLLIGMLLASLLGSVLYQQVTSGLVDQAIGNAQQDASQQVALAQEAFDSTDRTDDTGLRGAALEQIQTMVGTNIESRRRVLLLPSLENDRGPVVEAMSSGGVSYDQVPAALQEAVSSDPENQQVVVVPVTLDVGAEPVTSVVVGSRVSLLRAGAYDLVLVYPMEREEETLALLRQLFLAGGAALLLLMAGLSLLATRMATRPVSEVAGVAQQLAEGHLDERVPVEGRDEIATLATSFNTMADSLQHQIRELRSLSQLQQRFVSDVSHELRTPLTTMRMAGAVLHASREDFPVPLARSAELLDQEMDRFESLLTELLEISRFDSGSVQLERHEEDIVPVVRAAVDGVRALAQTHGSALVLNLPPQAVRVQMDGRRIARVLRNLLVNALEHGEGRPVIVTVAADDHVVTCSVRDHGIGLTEEQQAHVFDRFWRADASRARTTGGTGLGLAIATEDARVHGGWLQVSSVRGQGACFRLLLPRSARNVIADQPPPVPLPLGPEPSRGQPGEEPDRPGAVPALTGAVSPTTSGATGTAPGGTGDPTSPPGSATPGGSTAPAPAGSTGATAAVRHTPGDAVVPPVVLALASHRGTDPEEEDL